jgi:cation/acetate symporter
MDLWFGVANISAGLFGIPVGFIVMYVVSKMTAPPSQQMQDFVDQLRQPKGGSMSAELDAASA